MLCTISRWMISRAEDTGKKLPRFAERHVRRCGACSDYARSTASLSSRLRAERSGWLAQAPEFPSGLGAGREQLPAKTRARLLFGLRPLPVAASVIVLIAAGFVLLRVIPRDSAPSAEDRIAARAAIRTLASAPEELRGVMGAAESSLNRERQVLERSLASAVDYLQARLNIKIERKETPKTL